jgi:RsiW-degrading membrane proteinase PrsW (M82 family)
MATGLVPAYSRFSHGSALGGWVDELKVTFAGRAYRFTRGHRVRIGRSPDNSIVVPDPTVSRSHACVVWTTDGWQLDDLGKGRTYVGGVAVATVQVRQPLEVNLGNPLGPRLLIELDVPAAAGTAVLPADHAAGQRKPRDGDGARHAAGTVTRVRPADTDGPGHELPGADLATAMHILVPVRSWLKHPGWRQGSRLLVIAYGLLPSVFVVLFAGTSRQSAPGWAYSLAIAPLWAVAFWLIIRPGPVTRDVAWLAAGISAAVLILLPVLTIPWENALDKTASQHNPLLWIYAVGVAEEVTKALPLLLAALLLRRLAKITLDVRYWMFLGTLAGLTFGVWESVLYTTNTLMTIRQSPVQGVLLFALRVFVDGFQHAVWAGIAAFFIGIGVNYRRRRIALIAFGITLPAVLHGLNDWSTQLIPHWVWIGFEAISLVLFIGYTMSAASIERQVRETPLFRGESMVMDRATAPDAGSG